MQELRLERICNKKEDFTEQSKTLTNQLVKEVTMRVKYINKFQRHLGLKGLKNNPAKPKKPGSIKHNSTNTYI